MIKVDPIAQKTDGYQRNDNLMLSEHARADSIPGLEIEADDVRCTHGSTTGRVDDEQIFYCPCRGLTRKEAIRMIVAGFFQQVFDRITIDSVREALGEAIGRRIRRVRELQLNGGSLRHRLPIFVHVDFVRVAAVRLPDPGKELVEVDDRLIALFHVGGKFYAIDDVCTHDGGPLGEGELDGFTIACPRHGAQVRHSRRPGPDHAGHAADRCPRGENRRGRRFRSPQAVEWERCAR